MASNQKPKCVVTCNPTRITRFEGHSHVLALYVSNLDRPYKRVYAVEKAILQLADYLADDIHDRYPVDTSFGSSTAVCMIDLKLSSNQRNDKQKWERIDQICRDELIEWFTRPVEFQ